jgi:hypothetical protein
MNMSPTLILVTLLSLGAVNSSAGPRQTENGIRHRDPANFAQQDPVTDFAGILELVESSNFRFKADRAFPQGGRTIDMASRSNKLEVKGEIASADLAFFGRARNVAYDPGGGGIQFEGEMTNRKIKVREKKDRVMLSFRVSGARDSFSCYLTVTAKGYANLSVNSNQRSTISYSGRIFALTEE